MNVDEDQEVEAGEKELNTDRLMTNIRHETVAKQQVKGRNLNSHKPQQSDEFKVTFAYQSKKSSLNMDDPDGIYQQQNLQ